MCEANYVPNIESGTELFSCVLLDSCVADPCPPNSDCTADFAVGGRFCSCNPHTGFRTDGAGNVPETGCLASTPVGSVEVSFRAGSVKYASETGLNFSFMINYTMQAGDQMTFSLPGFEGDSFDDLNYQANEGVYIPDENVHDLIGLLPPAKPLYESAGCFKDQGRTQSIQLLRDTSKERIVSGSICTSQYAADRLVTSVDTCAFFAKIQQQPGFCITKGNQCFYASDERVNADFFPAAASPTCPEVCDARPLVIVSPPCIVLALT